jgi:hypothetical protein
VLILWGGNDALALMKNSEPTVMTLAEYQANPPEAAWLTLNECELDLANCFYKANEKTDTIYRVYIPIRVPGTEGPSKVVLQTDQFNGVVLRLRDLRTEAEAVTWMQANSKYFEPQTFSGWVTTTTSDVKTTMPKGALTGNPITLDHDASKSWGKALGFLIFGLLCWVAVGLTLAKRKT